MRRSTSHFDQPIRLNRFLSWLHAGGAVNDGVFLDDYLIYWLCYYLAQGRHSTFPMPYDVVIDQGRPIKIPNPAFDTFWESRDDPTGEDAVERFNIQTQNQEIARELEEIDDEFAQINHNLHVVREEQEALEAEVVEAMGRGEISGPTTIQRYAERRRRSRLPFPWILIAGYLAIVLMILVEAYQLGLPYLDRTGVDTTNLPREWKTNPIGLLSGAGFALAAAAGLFGLWHFLLYRALVLFRNWETSAPGVIMRRVAGILGLCGALFVGTSFIAHLRHDASGYFNNLQAVQQGLSAGTDMSTGVFVFLTLLVPFTAAYLHYLMGQSSYWQRRRDIAANQAQWDREEVERLVPAETFADRMALLQQRRARLEQQRTHLQNDRPALAERANAAERQRRARLEQARQCTLVFANSLIAALEEKRFYFLRAANRRKAFPSPA